MFLLPALLLSGCAPSPGPSAGPAADTHDAVDTQDTADTPDPCVEPADPERQTDFGSVLERLGAQGCLAEEDIVLVEAVLAAGYERGTLHCDAVYRLSSPDGLHFSGTPERVLQHASVPDVVITEEGEHVLVYNDVTPWKLTELLRTDPARLWRQGLLGYGGVGMSVGTAESATFTEVLDLDLHLPAPQEAVDPDLGRRGDGPWRLVWLGVDLEDIDDDTGPLFSPMPHHFWRSVSDDLREFTPPFIAVDSSEGSTGGADPTVLDLADGGEILFVAPLDQYAIGWSSPDGETWSPTAEPDVPTEVSAATADAMPDPAGGYRLHYMKNGDRGNFLFSASTDGRTWAERDTLVRVSEGFNPSVTRAPDGTWWVYFNLNEPDCATE